MEHEVYGPVNKAVESANLLGNLPSSSIWALVALGLFIYLYWSTKKENEIRKSAVDAENKAAEALHKFALELALLRQLVEERLDRRNTDV